VEDKKRLKVARQKEKKHGDPPTTQKIDWVMNRNLQIISQRFASKRNMAEAGKSWNIVASNAANSTGMRRLDKKAKTTSKMVKSEK
jgi:hypothetical protein